MGDPETLSGFLQYGMENYPARDYALILWDHGGGPMEGVCWDELFSMDHLSLSELTEALEASALPGKLRWIGFDACLMGSVEVAEAVSPYADYMIASQETEPARGWNYAFLKGIESDASGAETGKRIIDCFFEDLKDSGDVLTLSCIDLSAIRDVVDCMDDFFQPISQQLDKEKFAGLSGLRMASTGFGRSVRGPQDSYDLVDLKDLVTRYGTMQETGLSGEVDEMQDFPLALVLKHPIVGRNINLLSCLDVSKELPGAQSFLMTKAMAMGADCALEVFHRAVGKTTELSRVGFAL